MLLDVVRAPQKALAQARKKGEKHAVQLLLVNSLVVAAALGLFMLRFSSFSAVFAGASVIVASTAFLLTFAASMFFAYVLQITVNTLGGSGRYADGLAAVAYSITAIALGLLASSLLLFVPLLGAVLAILVLSATAALSLATLYRAIKELFKTDMIVAFVAVSVLIISVVVAIYGIGLMSVANRLMMMG